MTILYKQNTFSIDINGEWVQILNSNADVCKMIQCDERNLISGDTFDVDGIGYTIQEDSIYHSILDRPFKKRVDYVKIKCSKLFIMPGSRAIQLQLI